MSLCYPLPVRLDVDAACDLWSTLAKCDGDVLLDASELRHLGTAGLQVILIARQRLQANGGSLSLRTPSPELLAALSRIGASWLVETPRSAA